MTELETHKAAATVTKERAAIPAREVRADARAIDATAILMIEVSRAAVQPRRRDALDAATWKRVKDAARARLHQDPRRRTSTAAAYRDLALIPALVAMAPREDVACGLTSSSISRNRSMVSRGGCPCTARALRPASC